MGYQGGDLSQPGPSRRAHRGEDVLLVWETRLGREFQPGGGPGRAARVGGGLLMQDEGTELHPEGPWAVPAPAALRQPLGSLLPPPLPGGHLAFSPVSSLQLACASTKSKVRQERAGGTGAWKPGSREEMGSLPPFTSQIHTHTHTHTSVSYTHLTLPTIHVLCRSRWSPYH